MVASRPKSSVPRSRSGATVQQASASRSQLKYEALVAENLRLHRLLAKLEAEQTSARSRIRVLEERIEELGTLLPPGSVKHLMSTDELLAIAAKGRTRKRKAPGV